MRHQYHHSIDIVPTILECIGMEFPKTLNGHEQVPLLGDLMKYSFDDADAPTPKERQCYAMLGTRGIWEKGWKAVTVHGPTSGIGNFDKDVWQLFHTDSDRAEAHDLAQQEPERLTQLIDLVRGGGQVQRAAARRPAPQYEIITDPRPQPEAPRSTYVYYPTRWRTPESVAVNARADHSDPADVTIATPEASGVIFAHGSRFGGHALFIKDQKPGTSASGIPPDQQFVSEAHGGQIRPGHGVHQESTGSTTKPTRDDEAVRQRGRRGHGPMQTQVATFTLCGDGLCIGRDLGDAVSSEYKAPYRFTGGIIHQVEVNVGDDHHVDLEKKQPRCWPASNGHPTDGMMTTIATDMRIPKARVDDSSG